MRRGEHSKRVRRVKDKMVKFACRKGLIIDPKKESAEKCGFLPKGRGRVRTLLREGNKITQSLFPECGECGYGAKTKVLIKREDGTWDWNLLA